MKHRLSSSGTDIGNHSVTIIGNSFGSSNLIGYEKQPTQIRGIIVAKFGDRNQMFAGYDQDMNRRSWLNVAKRDELVVLIDALARNIAADDAAEYAR